MRAGISQKYICTPEDIMITQAPMVFYWGGTHSCRFQNHIWLWGALQCPSIRDMNPFLHKSPWLRFDGPCWVWGCKKPKISKKIRGWLVKCGTHVTHHPQEWRRTPTQDASQLVLGNTCRTSGVHHFECVQLVVRSNMECIPQKTVSNDFLIWNSMSCITCFNLQSVAFIDVPCTIADQESHQFRNQNTHLLWWHTPSERHQGAVKISTKKLTNTNANKIAFNMPKSYKCILTHVQFWQKELLDLVATMRSGQLFKFEWRV